MKIHYSKKRCYVKMLAEFQKHKRVETGDSVFGLSDVTAVVSLLAGHLSVLLRRDHHVASARRLLVALLTMEYRSTDVCEMIVRKFGLAGSRGDMREVSMAACSFFYKLMKRRECYFQEHFADNLDGKSKRFLLDFIEFANLLVRSHINTLIRELDSGDGLQESSYLQSSEKVREHKIKKAKNVKMKYLDACFAEKKEGLESRFGFWYCDFAMFRPSSCVATLFYDKQNRKERMIMLCSRDWRLTRHTQSFLTREDVSDAFRDLRDVLFGRSSDFVSRLSTKYPPASESLMAEYLVLVKKVAGVLLRQIVDDLDLSERERSKLQVLDEIEALPEVIVSESHDEGASLSSGADGLFYQPALASSPEAADDRQLSRDHHASQSASKRVRFA